MTFVPTSPRAAYAGELVLGSSGSGKTRNFLKPNLLQCAGSYIVLDAKGRLSRLRPQVLGPVNWGRGEISPCAAW